MKRIKRTSCLWSGARAAARLERGVARPAGESRRPESGLSAPFIRRAYPGGISATGMPEGVNLAHAANDSENL